jgi:hydroxyethylthiazole kinase-like uncharacterized protein yjeF
MPSLYSTDQIRRAELQAQAGLEPLALMHRAARMVSDACASEARTLSSTAPIVALVGPGNNGGDALLAAILLRGRGFNAQALLLQPATNAAVAAARAANLPFLSSFPTPAPTDQTLFIDGLFGIGLSRPIEGRAAEWVATLNLLSLPVIAVDVPSGINADTGSIVGDHRGVAVRARRTLTFLGDKPGLRTGPGRAHAGEVQVQSLGIAVDFPDGTLVAEPEARMLAAPLIRASDSHKGHFGHVAVVGGSAGMRGAALLAALGAQRSGAGKVSIGAPDGWRPDPMHHPQFMSFPGEATDAGRYQAWVIGCGMGTGPRAKSVLRRLIHRSGSPRVIDADALNLLATDEALAAALRADSIPAVLTPHPLEAARLLGITTERVQADRITSARRIASRFRSIAVLKGAGTVCAHPDGHWAIIDAGSASLATAGTGDVLAGVIGGLLAQGLPPAWAACLGAYVHGRAGELFEAEVQGKIGLATGDLPTWVAKALNQLISSVAVRTT